MLSFLLSSLFWCHVTWVLVLEKSEEGGLGLGTLCLGTDLPSYLLNIYLPFFPQNTLDFKQQVLLFNPLSETPLVS